MVRLLVPACEHMPLPTLAKLLALAEAGEREVSRIASS